jgi:protein-ribulosamine 3-kinase
VRPAGAWAALSRAIASGVGRRFDDAPEKAVGGGSINECYRWSGADGPVFVKVAVPGRAVMLEAEADGLDALANARVVRVPRVLAHGVADGHAFLALEWIDFGGTTARSEALLGEQLAALHRITASQFGWRRDNTIGSTEQCNDRDTDWPRFFATQRLGFQLELAERNGYGGRLTERGRRLCGVLGGLFPGHRPHPSLLHGDLWSGNHGADAAGAPVIFDPAVYFGDREADIAMTQLFGGFGAAFYAAYDAVWPLPAGAGERTELYNLYHVLNHMNLFGGGYRRQAEAMIDRLLALVGG